MNKRKKFLTTFLLLIFAFLLIACNNASSYKKFTAEDGTTIGNEMIELADKYSNAKNKTESANGVIVSCIYDDTLKDFAINYGNDPLVTKIASLSLKLNLSSQSFNLDDYPLYKDALEIYYGSNSKEVSSLISQLNTALTSATTSKPGEINIKEDTRTIIGTVSLNEDNTYKIIILCSDDYYEE